MREQRRHQRIRFNDPPLVRLGYAGIVEAGCLENLSLGGLMVRTEHPLKMSDVFGCDFSVLGAVRIDLSAVVVGSVGGLCSARFLSGPISEQLLKDEIDEAISIGKASILSVNELQGRRVMRVSGGLNECLRGDFMHALTKAGVDEIDLSNVTLVDPAGAELCQVAQERGIGIIRPVRAIEGFPG